MTNLTKVRFFLFFQGRRFSYTPHNPADGEIWQHIEKLDHQGMNLIEKMSLPEFHSYLRATDNTICGRYPISLLLAVRGSLSTNKLSGREKKR